MIQQPFLFLILVIIGELRVFALSTTSEPSATPVTSATHISLATGDVSSEIVPILAAQFEGNASKVLIAQGSELSPVFETLVCGSIL